jgi:ferric-dicitrate binding protein FerR (iron transport regulator)
VSNAPYVEEILSEDELAALSAYEAGELESEERRIVEARLAGSEAARRALARLRHLRRAAPEWSVATIEPRRRRAIGDALEAALGARRRRRRFATATVGVLAAAAAVVLALRPERPEPPAAGQGEEVIRTGPGEHQLVSLGERAVAFLAEDSEAERAADPERPLRLRRGSARFVVHRDPRRRFIVVTDAADVIVHGTEFDVTVADGTTRVRVVRGEVEVKNPQGSRRLWAREEAHARPGQPPRLQFPVKALVTEGEPVIETGRPPGERSRRGE